MTSANMHGWEFLLPQDLEIIWDGISDTTPDHVKIISGKYLPNGSVMADTTTANATITFNLGYFIETDENHYVMLSGPPNYFVDGAKPMSALVRSDIWHFSPIQYCWKITTPNKPILFKKGTPIMFMMNYPVGLLEDTTLTIKKADERINAESSEYGENRSSMYDDFNGKNYPLLYKKLGTEGINHKNLKPTPSKPILENN